MQAALYVRQKQRQRRKKIRRDRLELPSNVATKEIAPFPRYPPNHWVRSVTRHSPNSMSVLAFVLASSWDIEKCWRRGVYRAVRNYTISWQSKPGRLL
jgi:hypothetical protein